MKDLSKSIIFLSLCFIFLVALGHPGQAWSKPTGKLVVVQGADPTTLDPHMHAENPAFSLLGHVYDYLVKRTIEDGKLKHYPMLATSWEATNDTTWIFRLRKGVKFHNGEDFNAESVKYSIERVLNPAQKAKYRWAFTSIERVDIIDPYTVKITTKRPDPTLIHNLGFVLQIVPSKYFKEKGDAYVAGHPVGTGPFKFVRWTKDEEIVLEANEDYWAGPPKLKTLVFRPIPEDSSRVAALLGGDVDIVKKIPNHLIPMVNKSKVAKMIVVPSSQGIGVHMDSVKEGSPLQDKRVRQALNYGVDKEAIIKHILEGYGKPLGSPVPPFAFGYDPSVKPYPYNPEKAKALLKEAGYEKGLKLTYNSCSGKYSKDKEFAQAISGQLADVGVDVDVKVHEWGNYIGKIYSPEGLGPLWTIGWGSFDADFILNPLLRCGATFSRYCNKEFDSLLDQARNTLDQEKRKEIYSQALKLCHEEAPWIFLFYGVYTYGVNNRVQNFSPTPDENTSMYMYGVSVKD